MELHRIQQKVYDLIEKAAEEDPEIMGFLLGRRTGKSFLFLHIEEKFCGKYLGEGVTNPYLPV